MKTHIFNKIKYDLKGHRRSLLFKDTTFLRYIFTKMLILSKLYLNADIT